MSSREVAETLDFQAEITQLLDLMIHSLYSTKDIFLRELISNASDAIDRLRFAALSDERLYEGDTAYQIQVSYDPAARTITIVDNGIGMTRDEVVEHIGTIARSGTKAFLQSLTGDQQRDAHLIGQFGVGFYSAFVVADRVTLTTRHAGLPTATGTRWESEGKGSYTITTADVPVRGTQITLHLRDGEDDLLDGARLRTIIRTYSDHIVVPILMPSEEPDATAPEQVNQAAALWTRPKATITPEEYAACYRNLTHDFDDPLLTIHSRMEGTLEYTLLLFIPTEAPFDLWQRDRQHGVKLYVRRVFILEDTAHLLPSYLRFIRGLIDSNDLPLNVSRELLQQNRLIDQMRSTAVKKILGALTELAEQDAAKYATFWEAFGRAFKEGLVEERTQGSTLLPLLRFASTADATGTQATALAQYRERMRPGQNTIYYVIADSYTAASESPLLEVFRQKGVEVLLLTDPVDAFIETSLREFEGVPFHSVARGAIDLSAIAPLETNDTPQQDAPAPVDDAVLPRMAEVLSEAVKEVRATTRLTTSPACLVNDEQALDPALARLLKANGQAVPETRLILEINLAHPIVRRMAEATDTQRFAEWAQLLYEQAILTRGDQLVHPARFVERLNTLLTEA